MYASTLRAGMECSSACLLRCKYCATSGALITAAIQPGTLPSLNIFSSLSISFRLVAFLTSFSYRDFSSSVSFVLILFDPASAPPFTPDSTSGLPALTLKIVCAASLGSSVDGPNSSFAAERSESRTFA